VYNYAYRTTASLTYYSPCAMYQQRKFEVAYIYVLLNVQFRINLCYNFNYTVCNAIAAKDWWYWGCS